MSYKTNIAEILVMLKKDQEDLKFALELATKIEKHAHIMLPSQSQLANCPDVKEHFGDRDISGLLACFNTVSGVSFMKQKLSLALSRKAEIETKEQKLAKQKKGRSSVSKEAQTPQLIEVVALKSAVSPAQCENGDTQDGESHLGSLTEIAKGLTENELFHLILIAKAAQYAQRKATFHLSEISLADYYYTDIAVPLLAVLSTPELTQRFIVESCAIMRLKDSTSKSTAGVERAA